MAAEKKTKRVIDWEAVEMHFRAGVRSLEEIGKEFGITKGRISQVAKAKDWSRDLKGKIQAKADAKMARAAAQAKLNEAELNDKTKQASRRLTEAEVVDSNVDDQVRIRIEHRTDIGRSRKLFQKLMDELEATTDNKEMFELLGQLLDRSDTDENGRERLDKLKQIYQKVISMPGRVDAAKKLAEILEKVVKLEREAFGIDNNEKQASPIDELLLKIARERSA